MGRCPSSPGIITIERQEQIDDICRQCRTEERVAFDTEFVMEDRFEPDVCLIQLATRSSVAIIDPFLDLNLRPVWDLVCDEGVETVVHAGQEDLGLCVQHTGKVPRRVYDVQIAAGLVGYDYPLSLQKLVQTTMHVRLHKSKTLTDWRKRPLTPEQIRYGAEDVSYLLPVHQKLHERLRRLNRTDWAFEEFARYQEMSLYRRAEEEKLTRVKGSGSLKGRQLAVVRELLAWREVLAQQLDRPVRVVLKDHLLVEIARLGLHSFREIRDLRGLNLSDRNVRALCHVVEQALKTPSEQWPRPAPRQTESPKEAALVALVTAVIRSRCMEHDMSYSLVASKRSIRELIGHCIQGQPADRASVELLNGWRGQAIGAILEDVLSGRRVICIETLDGDRKIRIVHPNEADPSQNPGT